MALDHGLLNVPLHRRGNIDAQLDRFKRDEAVAAATRRKADHAQFLADKKVAKALLAEQKDSLLAKHGERFGRVELSAELESMAKWKPAKLIALINRHVSETA
jgi:hypothetical protein